jgi:4-alpha-glucanotransferase
MKITFKINYYTHWGQQLFITGSAMEFGSDDLSSALQMSHTGNGNWEASVEIDPKKASNLHYKYLVKTEHDSHIIQEWGQPRALNLVRLKIKNLNLQDAWRPRQDIENPLLSQAFAGNLFRRVGTTKPNIDKEANVRLQLIAPRIGHDQSFCIVGSSKALGGWNPERCFIMSDAQYPVWQAVFKLEAEDCEYKYGIYDNKAKRLLEWEGGENRYFSMNGQQKGDMLIKTDLKFNYTISNWKGAGLAIPVFSIRTKNSWGIGEFSDIKLLIDWAVKTDLKLVQILPINDTVATHTWTDSYPYAAISVFALHPIYLHPPKVGLLKDKKENQKYIEEATRLNELPQIDYEAVMKLKSAYYKKIFDQDKHQFLNDPSYQVFFQENKEWLQPYAAFSRLRDLHKTPDFTKWAEHAHYRKDMVDSLTNPSNADFDDYAVHYFIQYHLHRQMSEAAEYARQKSVVLKGDLPIGIYRNSVDAWMEPHLYNMDKQAGAPPDDYAISGQNWGFPTYNWEEMARDGYHWWRMRLAKMATYFDAYRIDHILGFFRIWEIPWHSVEGLMGTFNPAIPMYRSELASYGLYYDYDRYCKPYIREYMLDELFGDDKREVINTYLNKGEHDFYYLKDTFDTQRKVEEHIAMLMRADMDKERLLKIKYGLFTLNGNVLLFEDPNTNGEGFHPRIALHFTYSFKELNDASKSALDKIYIHYYYQRQEHFWRDKAMVKLPAIIEATNMLVCGEDLGMVPECVPGVMDELGILNLEIQRMPKGTNDEFGHPGHTKYLSVVSPSCHDMSTIRGWWEEDKDRTQRFYNNILGHHGAPPQFCEPWVSREMVLQHLHSPAMWAIFPIQDLVAMDEKLRVQNPFGERINEPSNPKHYWRFRFHLYMEDLLSNDELNTVLRDLIRLTGREG